MDSLAAPYPERTIGTIRAAMASSDNPAEQAQEIIQVIGALGLEPYIPPDPLPGTSASQWSFPVIDMGGNGIHVDHASCSNC